MAIKPPLREFPPIPTRIVVSGDVSAGKSLIGTARGHLLKLARSMEFNDGVKTGSKKIILNDGSIIRVSMGHGLSKIEIVTPTGEGPVKKPKKLFCTCGCHTTTGYIRRIVADGKDVTMLCRGSHENYTHLFDEVRYDVELCQRKNSNDENVYVLLQGCLASDNTMFSYGDHVTVLWVPVDDQSFQESIGEEGCSSFLTDDNNTTGLVCPFDPGVPKERARND